MPGAPPRLFRVLDRAGPTVHAAEFYRRLGAAAVSPFAEVVLGATRPVDMALLRHIEGLAGVGDAIQRLPASVLSDVTATGAIGALAAVLRSYGRDADAALANLPHGAGVSAIYCRLTDALSTLSAPVAPMPLPTGMRQVMSVGDLRAIGRRLDLCVRDALHSGAKHWMALLEGHAIYLTTDHPDGLVELRRVGPDLVSIADARRRGNTPMAPPHLRRLRDAMSEAGWRFVAVEPADALVALAARVDDEFCSLNRTFGEMLHALDNDWG
ncbi:hypothetical protein G3576_30400 [Roseomonas stagni]|uniref:Uncharacterized protein n=1 Tax=Falsiroseomonas algicola TaxID=2716930 RepID=A0A6M1LV41_9PROT|nr:hypothetical protein [Falsiroseomonas algicola]NGM24338.1 hypothetical protein [Falsiroseomonas algicola]